MPPVSVGHYASLPFVVIGRGQMTEDRKQRTENREQKTENRKQRTENREQKTAGRGWILDCRFEIGESIGHRVRSQ